MLQIFPSHNINLFIGLCLSPGPAFQNYQYPLSVEKRPYPSIVCFFQLYSLYFTCIILSFSESSFLII